MKSRSLTRVVRALQVGVALMVFSSTSFAQQLAAVMDKAGKLYAGTKTARGTVEQTLTNSLTRNTYVTRADYQQQFPDRVSLRFTDPRGDLIVADGKAVWIYQPNDNPREALKAPMSFADTWIKIFEVLLTSPETRFTLTDAGRETVQGAATRVVALVPKAPIPNMLRARLWIEEATGIVRQFEIAENSDEVRRIRFTTLQLNAPVEADKFTFTPPRNVQVRNIGG